MFKILRELADKIADEKLKSEFLAELKKSEESNLITMPKNLEELLSDEKFADFKSQYNAREGSLRTKWDEEQKEKKLKENLEKSDGKETNTTETMLKELMTGINKNFEKINTDISGLRSEKTIDSLKNYVKEKLDKLPPEFSEFIDINADTTSTDIDKKIEILTKIRENDLKKVDGQPDISQNNTNDGGVSEINTILDEKLGTKKEE